MVDSEILARTAIIDAAREADEISADVYAKVTVRLWAAHRDDVQPIAAGPTNTEIVEGLLTSEADREAAFYTGYNGHVWYPLKFTPLVSNEMERVFGSRISKSSGSGTSQLSRATAVAETVAETPDADGWERFAYQIMAAHSLYQFIDGRITRGYKQDIEGDVNIQIAPGHEEDYWRSRVYGSYNNPGVVQTFGSISRLLQEIDAFAKPTYEADADEFIEAWWATANILKPLGGETYKDTMQPILRALITKDLGSAKYLLKECAYEDDSVFPYRSRAKLAPDIDERTFFAELAAENQPKPKEHHDILDPEHRGELLKRSLGYIGTVMSFKTEKGSRLGIVRGIGIPVRRTKKLRFNDQEDYIQIPYALIVDYCHADENNTITVMNGSSNRPVLIENFMRRIISGKVELVDTDEKYLDPNQKTFTITAT